MFYCEKQPVLAKRVKVGEEAEITFLPISSRAAPKSAHLSSVGSIFTHWPPLKGLIRWAGGVRILRHVDDMGKW